MRSATAAGATTKRSTALRALAACALVVAVVVAVSCHVCKPADCRSLATEIDRGVDGGLPPSIRVAVGGVLSTIADGLSACERNRVDTRSCRVDGRCAGRMGDELGERVNTAFRSASVFAEAYERYERAAEASQAPDCCERGFVATRATDARADAKRALEHLVAALDELETGTDGCRPPQGTLSGAARGTYEVQLRALPRLLYDVENKLDSRLAASCTEAQRRACRVSSPDMGTVAARTVKTTTESTPEKVTTTTTTTSLPPSPAAPRAKGRKR